MYDAHPPYAGAVLSKSRSMRMVGSNQVAPRVPAGNYAVAHIAYELNVLGSRYITLIIPTFCFLDFCSIFVLDY